MKYSLMPSNGIFRIYCPCGKELPSICKCFLLFKYYPFIIDHLVLQIDYYDAHLCVF